MKEPSGEEKETEEQKKVGDPSCEKGELQQHFIFCVPD